MRSRLNACRRGPHSYRRPRRAVLRGPPVERCWANGYADRRRRTDCSLPPVAPRRPSQRTLHGITVVDDYAWLKDANWQEVLRNPALLDPDIRAYLEAENRYTEAFLGPLQALQKTLVAEMRGRIKEDDSSVPAARRAVRLSLEIPRRRPARIDRPHAARRRRGPGPARRRRHGQGPAVLRFRRHAPFARPSPRSLERRRARLGVLHHPRARLADRRGSARRHRADQRQRRLGPRFDASSTTSGSTTIIGRCTSIAIGWARRRATMCWSTRSRTTAGSCVVEESASGRFCIVATGNQETSERWLIDLADADAVPRLVAARETGVRYSVSRPRR